MPPPPDSRNDFSGRQERLFRRYIVAVTVLGLSVLPLSLLCLTPRGVLSLEPAFWAICALLVLTEVRPIFAAGARDANGLHLSTSFVFALLLRYGLPIAILVQALATILADVAQRKAPWRTAFNIGQYSLSWSAASAVMYLVGHDAQVEAPLDLMTVDLLSAGLGGITYFAVNQVLVGGAVALKTGQPMWRLIRDDLPYESATNGALLALSPLVAIVVERGTAFLPLLLPPLIAVYRVASISLEREHQAQTDALTGLPNRTLLTTRTAESLAESGEDGTALLLVDLDRFKEVNDTLGHHVGDRFLQVIAKRLAAAVRPDDTVVRLGGDEFAILLPATAAAAAEETARRLLDSVCAPIVLEGLQVDVDASIGIAVAPQHGTDLDVLLQHADVAMYLAKETGSGVEQYDASRDRNTTSRLVMLGELRRALVEGELEVHYQPQAELRSGRVTGVEALVRWRHPVRGLVPPDEFVPLAESSGLVESLTRHVLDTALAQVAQWRAQGLSLKVAVNVSVRDLSGTELVRSVREALERHDVPADCLLLEVTEGSLFAESHRAATTLRQLEELGVALALDDFGTGWSSLGHLRRLPVQELKVDRSFVQRMCEDVRDSAIVRSVVDLGVGLGMRVVAEGVEDEATWALLLEMGCDEAQGWLLSRAEPAAVLTPWLLERQERLSAVLS
ncbi:MAG: diguanylate cyclase/phosphodiesterase [Frankiales bacterium]|nr:diguanylate cyclase/phosphodiesterase [Frankiales bacterium]